MVGRSYRRLWLVAALLGLVTGGLVSTNAEAAEQQGWACDSPSKCGAGNYNCKATCNTTCVCAIW